MSVPEARRHPALSRYPLRRHRLSVAGGTLSIIAPDGQAWLHRGGWSARLAGADEPPYWADIWPASVALARWLCRRRDLAGRAVLDLGCGVGVSGAAAARVGASVTCADREPDALSFARFNAEQASNGAARVETQRLDWHRDEVRGPLDVICLADVTYRPVHHAAVLRQSLAGLAADGIAVHVDPFRRESDGFLAMANSRLVVRTVAAATFFDDRRIPVRFAFLAREAAVLSAWLGPVPPAIAADGLHSGGSAPRSTVAQQGIA